MRTPWNGVLRSIALLGLLVTGLPSASADDTSGIFDPLGSRIQPPSGVASQARILPPSGDPIGDARIGPPGGEPIEDGRIGPPSGDPQPNARILPPGGVTEPEPGWFALLVDWLRAQARISPPTG